MRYLLGAQVFFLTTKLLSRKDVIWVGQNIRFDSKHIFFQLGVKLHRIMDTFLIEKILYTGYPYKGYSLEHLAKRYLNYKYAKTNQLDMFAPVPVATLSKETRNSFRNIRDRFMTDTEILYGAKDVELTHRVYLKQLYKIANWQLWTLVYLEHHFLQVLIHMELAGFYLNQELWLEQEKKNLAAFEVAKNKLFEMIEEAGVDRFYNFQQALFEVDGAQVDINLSSSRQVVELCQALGIPTLVVDKKKSKEQGRDIFKDSVEEKHLRKYQDQHPIIKPYLEYKRLEKAITTYGHKFLEHVNPVTGRIHSNFQQIVRSGRVASSKPNLQNIPSQNKFKGFRPCFRVGIGKVLVVADYSSQESRILASLAQEDQMIDFFLNGDGDLHSHTARLMFKVPVQKEITDEEGNIIQEGKNLHLRQLAKTINFGIAYGMSAYKLSNDFEISLEEAQEFINSYFKAYPKLEAYFNRCQELAMKRTFILIDDITNRRSWNGSLQTQYEENARLVRQYRSYGHKAPKEVFSLMNQAKGQIARNSQNYPIQGTAASMTKLAAIYMLGYIEEYRLQASIVNLVHDEIVIEASEEHAEVCQTLLEESMKRAGKVFVKDIPMEVECVISKVWEH